jgi:hypothetical protein
MIVGVKDADVDAVGLDPNDLRRAHSSEAVKLLERHVSGDECSATKFGFGSTA